MKYFRNFWFNRASVYSYHDEADCVKYGKARYTHLHTAVGLGVKCGLGRRLSSVYIGRIILNL